MYNGVIIILYVTKILVEHSSPPCTCRNFSIESICCIVVKVISCSEYVIKEEPFPLWHNWHHVLF